MDPREVARLLAIIAARGHAMGYTKRSQTELRELGLVPVTGQVIEHDPEAKQIMICTVILPGEAMNLPDNVTGPCSWKCGRMVQYRP